MGKGISGRRGRTRRGRRRRRRSGGEENIGDSAEQAEIEAEVPPAIVVVGVDPQGGVDGIGKRRGGGLPSEDGSVRGRRSGVADAIGYRRRKGYIAGREAPFRPGGDRPLSGVM